MIDCVGQGTHEWGVRQVKGLQRRSQHGDVPALNLVQLEGQHLGKARAIACIRVQAMEV